MTRGKIVTDAYSGAKRAANAWLVTGSDREGFICRMMELFAGYGAWTPDEKFQRNRKKDLQVQPECVNIIKPSGADGDFRVWRSLVSRLNGVQEAAGSNPVTRTNKLDFKSKDLRSFFVVLKTLLLLFFCELYREKTKIAGSEQFSEQLKASKILLILFDVSSAAASGTWV